MRGTRLQRLKQDIIKKCMRLVETNPEFTQWRWTETFNHPAFRKADNGMRKQFMWQVSRFRYLSEHEHPFDEYFEIDLKPLLRGRAVLDLGCFAGGRSVAWAERYQLGKIIGLDIWPIYLEAAAHFANKKGTNARFLAGSGERLPFSESSFDAILTFDVFEHVRNVEQVLGECYRVLRPGGMLCVVFPSFFHPIEHHLSLVTKTPFLHWLFDPEDLIEVYCQILDERGKEAEWYRRGTRSLRAWERGNTINGTTLRKFRSLLRADSWGIYYHNPLPLFQAGQMSGRYRPLRVISAAIRPLARLPILEEFLTHRIVFILRKRQA